MSLHCDLQRESSEESDLSVPNVSIRAGFDTLLPMAVTGCQGFIGPIPSAFLDKITKELR